MSKGSPIFLNRELSWLEFNQRVLDEAQDPQVPLLDRLFFLSITASNLDEFFMVRVGGLAQLVEQGVRRRDAAGLTPKQQLTRILKRARAMTAAQYACYAEQLAPELAEEGILRLVPGQLSSAQLEHARNVFNEEIFPVLTPMAIHAGRPFPALMGRRLHLAVGLRGEADMPLRLAIVPLESNMPRFVRLPGEEAFAYITLEDLIGMFVEQLFPGQDITETVPFRLTRNADISVQEDLAPDFLALMEDVLVQRTESNCVRLELRRGGSRALASVLREALRVSAAHVVTVPGPMELGAFNALAFMDGFDHLRYPQWQPQPSPELDRSRSIFEQISEKSTLLAHPFDSFDPVIKLVEDAAADPNVLAIKQTLYRTSDRSPIIAALRKAAGAGKSVTALVELKARFDEARNIEWAKDLERCGVHVIYGVRGLKTHSKITLVVRREAGGIARYMHFGTGNYNEKTAGLYTDVSYLTRDPDLGADASIFFNAITGYSEPRQLAKLVAAPLGLREAIIALIDSEIERRKQGQKALIRAKMNSLVCPEIIKALYRASKAGVKIELNIRGICCLRPGVKGLSANITVVSIIDRFLEHSRIFQFCHGGQNLVFISSADWMPRNLDRRVELMVPIEDKACKRKVIGLLDACFADQVKGRLIDGDGDYSLPETKAGRSTRSCQQRLCRRAEKAHKDAMQASRRTFEPIAPPDAES